MGLNIVLQNERGDVLEEVVDARGSLLQLTTQIDLAKTSCLRFIDLYGDTVFNRLQMPQLRMELADLRGLADDAEQTQLVTRIEELAMKCEQGPHLYIKIYGD